MPPVYHISDADLAATKRLVAKHGSGAETMVLKRLIVNAELAQSFIDELSQVIPSDFKAWHDNSRSELPSIAAWVITNLREQLKEARAETRCDCYREHDEYCPVRENR